LGQNNAAWSWFGVQDFKKLHVWGKAHALALNAHRVAGQIRGTSYLSLRSQLIRAAMSIPTNIVEGRAKHSEREFGRFLRYALSSASELEYHLIAGRDLGLVHESDFVSLLTQVIEVRRMIHGLLNRMASTEQPEPGTVDDAPREA
jgi:four helix bundle protein